MHRVLRSRRSWIGAVALLCVGAVAGTGVAQTPAPITAGASQNFATITINGLGDQTTMAAEFRLPIMSSNVAYTPPGGLLHLKATGTRQVREILFELNNPQAGATVTFDAGAVLKVKMSDGVELSAGSNAQGSITVEEIDAQHVTGRYEATIPRGRSSVLIRGRFQANLGARRPAPPPPSAP